jgi:hypothetical protein
MSQPAAATQPPVSAPSQGTTVTADNTAQNAGINDPQSRAPASTTGAGAGGGSRDPQADISPEEAQKEGLPEQKHAGAVGYGPSFANNNSAVSTHFNLHRVNLVLMVF